MSKKMIILCVIGLIIITYIAMFVSTNSVVNDVKNVMLGNVSAAEIEGTPLSRYNVKKWSPDSIVEADITRIFVWHNFVDGYMYVRYSYKGVDENGEILTASGPLFSLWKIHRENGKWKVVEIQEAP